MDEKGNLVTKTSSTENIKGDKCVFNQKLSVRNPELWSVKNPYLYKVVSNVYVGDKLYDTYNTSMGFRSFKFDKDKGFFLNGENVKLKGVCLHHDLGPLGAAVNYRALERQLKIMQEMGCNVIRTSHNPPTPELLELCDKMGFLFRLRLSTNGVSERNRNGNITFFVLMSWGRTRPYSNDSSRS